MVSAGPAIVRIPFVGAVLVFPPIGQAVAIRIHGGSRQHQVDPVGGGAVGLACGEVVGGGRDERGWFAVDQDLDVLQAPARGGERNVVAGDGQIEREGLVRDREPIGEPAVAERFEAGGEGGLAASLVLAKRASISIRRR